MPDEEREQWKKRMVVVGQAQARYLWILLLVGLFYWALHSSMLSETPGREVRAPLLGIELSSNVLLASAPFVIFLLIIIIHGTFRAFTTAKNNLKLEEGNFEHYDLAPNPIDFAAYNPKKVSNIPAAFLLLAYPLYLSIFWIEAIFLLVELVFSDVPLLGRWLFVIFGFVLAIIATILMHRFWSNRLTSIWNIIKKRPNEKTA